MRALVVAHVFYPQFWPELAECIRNVAEARRIVITYGDEAAVTAARRDFPRAEFVRCENRGYDIWPFLNVLQRVDLADYDIVVKLHTKRNVDLRIKMNHAWFDGTLWRDYLLGFVRTPDAWRRTLRCLGRPGVGLVADRRVIFDRDTVGPGYFATYDRACDEIAALAGRRLSKAELDCGGYVAGTMFAIRTEPLRLLLRKRFTAEMFETYGGHARETYAHVMERMLGLCVTAVGFRLAAFNGSVGLRRWYYGRSVSAKVVRMFFRYRIIGDRRVVSVFKIPVFSLRISCRDAS